jgi:glycyl-tRNA synthetase beta chain
MFITVANVESRNLAAVRAGNERVVRPRLSDAAFFWDSDRRHTLASRCEALKAVTFQAQLGSYHQKSARVATLGAELASVTGADPAEVRRAAAIAKCDLLTGLVGEFTELQGIMGAYYARLDGETAAVAAAMAEQYQPRFAGDALPVGAVGTALALADKLDTIVGIFAIGQRPSGTRDPFGLRRAAVGFLRIVLERRLELDLPALIKCAFTSAEADIASVSATRTAAPGGAATGGNPAEVYDYVMERLRAHYVESEQGITVEMFDAVLERRPVSPLDFDRRLAALHAFLQLEAAPALAAANKRIANILKKAAVAIGVVDPSRFVEAEEAALAAAVQAIRPEVGALIAERDYTAALQRLATLRPPVDAFFDRVMVMHEDAAVRSNRLNLLGAVRALFLEIADLSRLPG